MGSNELEKLANKTERTFDINGENLPAVGGNFKKNADDYTGLLGFEFL